MRYDAILVPLEVFTHILHNSPCRSVLLVAISRALCEHAAGPHPDQGQLRGAGGHRGDQGHLQKISQQVRPVLFVGSAVVNGTF